MSSGFLKNGTPAVDVEAREKTQHINVSQEVDLDQLELDVNQNNTKGDFTTADESKLDGIEPGAQVNPTDAEIKSALENNADTNTLTDAQVTKLANIQDNAEVNQTDSEIKTQYENNPNTNAFTDALNNHYQAPLNTTVELTALPEAGLASKMRRFVESENADYFYDLTATSGDLAPDDQTGGTGFWIKGAGASIGGGNPEENVITVNSNTVLGTGHQTVLTDSSSGSLDLDFPPTPSTNQIVIVIPDDDSDSNPINLRGNGNSVNGKNSFIINEERGSKVFLFTNGEWKLAYGYENMFYIDETGKIRARNGLSLNVDVLAGAQGDTFSKTASSGIVIDPVNGSNIELVDNHYQIIKNVLSANRFIGASISGDETNGANMIDQNNSTLGTVNNQNSFITISNFGTQSIDRILARFKSQNSSYTVGIVQVEVSTNMSDWDVVWSDFELTNSTSQQLRVLELGFNPNVVGVRIQIDGGDATPRIDVHEIEAYSLTEATTETDVRAVLYEGNTVGLDNSLLSIEDETDTPYTNLVTVDYSIDNAPFTGSFISITAFQALALSLFETVNKLEVIYRLSGTSKLKTAKIVARDSFAKMNGDGFIVNSLGTEVFKAEKDKTTINTMLVKKSYDVNDADYTTAKDYRVAFKTLTAPRTLTVSSADIAIDGMEMLIDDSSGLAETHNIIIATEGSETINGNSTITIDINFGRIVLTSDGTNLSAVVVGNGTGGAQTPQIFQTGVVDTLANIKSAGLELHKSYGVITVSSGDDSLDLPLASTGAGIITVKSLGSGTSHIDVNKQGSDNLYLDATLVSGARVTDPVLGKSFTFVSDGVDTWMVI